MNGSVYMLGCILMNVNIDTMLVGKIQQIQQTLFSIFSFFYAESCRFSCSPAANVQYPCPLCLAVG